MQILRWTHMAAAALVGAVLCASPGGGQTAQAQERPAHSARRQADGRGNPLRSAQNSINQAKRQSPQFSRATPSANRQQPVKRSAAAQQAAAHVAAANVRRVSRAHQDAQVPVVPQDQPEVIDPPMTEGDVYYEGDVSGYGQEAYGEGLYGYGDCGGCGECADCCNSCCNLCGPPGRFWVNADYLLWWTKDSRYPALVTQSPLSVPVSEAGVLGLPTTTILFGDNREGNDSLNGARIRFGMWLDNCHCWGVEGDYFAINDDTLNLTFMCDEGTTLARPFFNTQTGLQDSELVCYEGIVDGAVTVNTSSSFQGAGGRLRKNIICDSFCDPCGFGNRGCGPAWASQSYHKVDFLGGFRFYRLDDGLSVTENLVSTNTGGVIPLGTTFFVLDDFRTRNEFYGGELGVHLDTRRGRWGADFLALMALGNNRQVADISGFTVTQVPGQTSNGVPGGLLAQATNSGHFENDDFIVIPQFGANLSYYLTNNLKMHVGYTVIYWDRVVRAGEIIDPNINTSQIPPGTLTGDALPSFNFNDTSYWAHGLNFGGELRF